MLASTDSRVGLIGESTVCPDDMPDKRRHRGPHPADSELFSAERVPVLRSAVDHLSWLLTRDYSINASLELVGNRFQLADRQRKAVMRSACSDSSCTRRAMACLSDVNVAGQELLIDGFNVLTSVEAALSGGVLMRGRDGCLRDMASMHGTYRQVQETERSLECIGRVIQLHGFSAVHWFLDRPVSNSARLAQTIERTAASRGWTWTTELVADPDACLILAESGVVASADSVVIENSVQWWPLANAVIESLEQPWIIDLGNPNR